MRRLSDCDIFRSDSKKGGQKMTYSEQMVDQLEAGKLKEAQNSFKLALINDDDDMLFSLAEELYALGFLQQALS